MIDLFITLMAEALPDRITGAQCADPMNVMFAGGDPSTGESWMFGEATAIGWGPSRDLDGENGLANYGGGDLKNYPAEVLESKYPIRIDSYGLLPDSGGPGAGAAGWPSSGTSPRWRRRRCRCGWNAPSPDRGGSSAACRAAPPLPGSASRRNHAGPAEMQPHSDSGGQRRCEWSPAAEAATATRPSGSPSWSAPTWPTGTSRRPPPRGSTTAYEGGPAMTAAGPWLIRSTLCLDVATGEARSG